MELVHHNKRNSRIELLRVLAMLMIVMEHMLLYSDLQLSGGLYYFVWALRSLCKVNVNCFVLISGYFWINQKKVSKRYILFALEVLFYSLLSCGIYAVIRGISLKRMVAACLPILSGQYWFATCFAVLLLLTPLIRQILQRVSRKQLAGLIIVLYVVTRIYPNFTLLDSGGGRDYLWIIIVYLTGAWCSMDGKRIAPKICLFGYVAASALLFASKVLLEQGGMAEYSRILFRNDSPLVFAASVLLFLVFVQGKTSDCPRAERRTTAKWINVLAASAFAVYLLHDGVLAELLWSFIDIGRFADSWVFVPAVLICAVLIYLFGLILSQPFQMVKRYLAKNKAFCQWTDKIDRKLMDLIVWED